MPATNRCFTNLKTEDGLPADIVFLEMQGLALR
jgi:hypothetical protein